MYLAFQERQTELTSGCKKDLHTGFLNQDICKYVLFTNMLLYLKAPLLLCGMTCILQSSINSYQNTLSTAWTCISSAVIVCKLCVHDWLHVCVSLPSCVLWADLLLWTVHPAHPFSCLWGRTHSAGVTQWEQLVPVFLWSHLSAVTIVWLAYPFPSGVFCLGHADGEWSFFSTWLSRLPSKKGGKGFLQSPCWVSLQQRCDLLWVWAYVDIYVKLERLRHAAFTLPWEADSSWCSGSASWPPLMLHAPHFKPDSGFSCATKLWPKMSVIS